MVSISVCVGSACHLKGAYNIIKKFQELINENNLEHQVELKAAFCLGKCTSSVSVKVDDNIYSVSEENTEKFFDEIVIGRS